MMTTRGGNRYERTFMEWFIRPGIGNENWVSRTNYEIPAGCASNESVHEMDLFPTFAKIAGGRVPNDCVIDGVDQSDFFMGGNCSGVRPLCSLAL